MRTATAGEQTVLGARQSKHYLKVEVKDSGGNWVAYDLRSGVDWQDRVEITQDANQRVQQATVLLAREADGNSLAPLINADIAAGRAMRISGARVAVGATPASGDYKPLFLGEVDSWDAAADPMALVGRDDMGHLVDRWVEEETVYGTEAGRAIESVMQDLLDDWTDGRFTLYTPSSPGFLITPYRQQRESVLDALQTLADLIGWVLEYRWDDGSSAFRLTFYEPDRTPAATDWTFGADDYYDVTRLAVDRLEVRNAVTVRYTNAATGERSAYHAEDATSITAYGRRWMEIEEAEDSPIDSDAEAQTMADAALADLATPVAEQEIEVDLFWPIQLGDYLQFTANDVHYDVNQSLACTGYRHVFEGGRGSTFITARGAGAVGHTRGWIKRERRERPVVETVRAIELLNFREISRTATTIKYGWTLGADLAMSVIHNFVEDQPYSVDKWPADTRLPDSIISTREVEFTVNIPEQGQIRYFQVEGRRADGSLGDIERVLIFPANVAGDYIAFAACTVNQSDGSVKISGWSTDRAQSVAYAFNVGAADTVAAPSESDAESQGGSADGGGLVTGFSSDFEITLAAGTVEFGEVIKGLLIAYINTDGTGPDGTAQDHDTPVGFQGERFKITDSDQLDTGVVIAGKLRDSAKGFNTDIVFGAVDWNTTEWSAGTLDLADGSSYSILAGNTGDLADDNPRWIYFDRNISTTELQVATAYTDAVGEDAIFLCITRRALAGAASGQETLVVPAVGVLNLNADVVGPNAIAEVAIQVDAITTTKISDDAVTTPKLVAGSVTTAKIAALAVEADKIAANAITATKIAAGAVETDHLAANSVTAAKIDVAALSAISADLGTVTAGTVEANVVVASTSFTAATAVFDGHAQFQGGRLRTVLYVPSGGSDSFNGIGYGFHHSNAPTNDDNYDLIYDQDNGWLRLFADDLTPHFRFQLEAVDTALASAVGAQWVCEITGDSLSPSGAFGIRLNRPASIGQQAMGLSLLQGGVEKWSLGLDADSSVSHPDFYLFLPGVGDVMRAGSGGQFRMGYGIGSATADAAYLTISDVSGHSLDDMILLKPDVSTPSAIDRCIRVNNGAVVFGVDTSGRVGIGRDRLVGNDNWELAIRGFSQSMIGVPTSEPDGTDMESASIAFYLNGSQLRVKVKDGSGATATQAV